MRWCVQWLRYSNSFARCCSECKMRQVSVTVHTGNINELQQIVTKRHASTAKELSAAFNELSANNTLLEQEHGVLSPPHIALHTATNDIKDTLKVFLSSFSTNQLTDAVNSYQNALQLKSLAQLLIAFPAHLSEDLSDEEWIEKVLPIWREAESLVETDKVDTLGVADLDIERLRLLFKGSQLSPPQIVHYSIDGCCTVPNELVEFAKEHDIQILTHNDARHFEVDDSIKENVGKMVDDFKEHDYVENWIARYTIWLRSRSVVAARGFLVNFKHI